MAEKLTTAIKSLGNNRVGGLLVAFGSPNDKDLDGEYFTKDTNFELGWYKVRPVLYGHGADPGHKTTAIGTIDKIELMDDAGLWAEAQLRENFMYEEYVRRWLDEGRLGWSSGSSPYYVEVAKDGFIRTWPIHEGSLTLNPAQPAKTTVRRIKHYANATQVQKAVKELGLKNFDMEKIMLDFNEGDVDVEDVREDEPVEEVVHRPQKAVKIENEPSEDINKDIKMNNETKQQDEEVVVEITTERVTSLEQIQPQLDVLEVDASVKEVDSEYLQDMIMDRSYSLSVPIPQASLSEAMDSVKGWIANRTFSTPVTQSQVKQARSNSEFQKFLSETVKSYAPQQEEQSQDKSQEKIAQLEAKLSAMEENMIGKGGVSQLPMVDSMSRNSEAGKWDSFYIEDYAQKQNYANHEFADLVQYAVWRDEAARRGYLSNNKSWSLAADDPLYEAIFQTGKEVVPEIEDLIPNAHWMDHDLEHEPIHAVKAFRFMHSQRGKAVKANEVNHSTNTGRGAEWIWTLPDGNLWSTLMAETGVAGMFPRFNMIAGTVEMYIDDETGLPEVIPEITDGTTTDINVLGKYPVTPAGSQKVTFKARHIGQQTIVSKIEIEDARIDAVRVARLQLENALRRGIDWTIINAHNDTSGSDNYGHYGVDVSATAHTNKLYNIGFDGLIARALAGTNTAGQDMGGAMTLQGLRLARRQMNSRYYANLGMLRLIISPVMHDKMLNIDEFSNAMQYRGNFANQGRPAAIDSVPIVVSEQVVKRNDQGQLHSTADENTQETAIWVRPDRWKFGIRRRLVRSMQEWGTMNEYLKVGASTRYDFNGIPSALSGGSATIRKPVSVLYNINC